MNDEGGATPPLACILKKCAKICFKQLGSLYQYIRKAMSRVWEAETTSGTFQTGLSVQEVTFFFTKPKT